MGCKQSKKEILEGEENQEGGGEAGGEEQARLIVVFGATGRQGGSVLQALKADDKYRVRAVTRNPDGEKAKALAEQGVEVTQADCDDVDSLKKALDGAYGVFAVTDFFAVMDGEKETQQGKNIVDAAKECNVKHLVYSGLEDVKSAIDKTCQHFDSKGAVEKYIKDQEVPYSIVRYAFYYENLLTGMLIKPKKDQEGTYVLDLPMGDAPLGMICASEAGECIHQIFNDPDEYKGKEIGLASDKLKIEEYAAIMTKQIEGKTVEAGTCTPEDMAKGDLPMAADFAIMFEFYVSGKADRDVDATKKLNPEISSFEQWVENNKDALGAALG